MTAVPDLPLVAVVTPVLDGEPYLAEALASVQAQTYRPLVHVVLDNASTDATADLISAVTMQGDVPVIRHRMPATVPMVDNWNAAMALVPDDARYVHVLCADDVLHPEFTASLVEVAEADPAVRLVGCRVRSGDVEVPSTLPEDRCVFDGQAMVRRSLQMRGDDLPHMFGLFRRTPDDPVPFYDAGLWAFDTDACLRALCRGRFGFVHRRLYDYRDHPGQATHTVLRGSTSKLLDPLRLVDRYGPEVLDPRALRRVRRAHVRAIVRHILAARVHGDRDFADRLVADMTTLGAAPGPSDYAAAALEWPVLKVLWAVQPQRRSGRS